jgi:serine/threonine-protein kinase RsbW
VEFALIPRLKPEQFTVEVLDEGEGFDYQEVDDPLAPENLMKSSGRGIFFMRNFMDDVAIARRPEGGMSVRLVKRLS